MTRLKPGVSSVSLPDELATQMEFLLMYTKVADVRK